MITAIKYALFATLATFVNIGTQYVSLGVYNGPYSLYVGMFWGTLTGLIVKYILDKKYIFYFQMKNRFEDTQKFILYSLMGVITTFIFWGFELTFNSLFDCELGKYIGALIGLSIGYFMKYNLDKKFVFRPTFFRKLAQEKYTHNI